MELKKLALFITQEENKKMLARIPVLTEIEYLYFEIKEWDTDVHEFINFGRNPLLPKAELKRIINSTFSKLLSWSKYQRYPEADRKQLMSDFLLTFIQQYINSGLGSYEQISDSTIFKRILLQVLDQMKWPGKFPPEELVHCRYPIGMLASDQNGYLSYDLENLPENIKETLRSSLVTVNGMPELSADSTIKVIVYPWAKVEFRTEILSQKRFRNDAIVGTIALPSDLLKDGIERIGIPSLQSPSLTDWYLSPGSFALNPEYFIGEDGCERIYPANFATHEFNFYQLFRGRVVEEGYEPDINSLTPYKEEIRTGWTFNYRNSWQPLGHTLGQIIYSLPLAPGETVKIAVVDWSRKATESRDEDLAIKEQLSHNTHRDRSISETVDASLREWQRGGSIAGGLASSLGVSLAYGPLGVAAGAAHSLGGGYATSSGDRDIKASTVQKLSDSFAQSSTAMREMKSTIVLQGSQEESAKAETRVIANHNHSHALTMLYYEVLRHYRVTTEFVQMKPIALVKYQQITFNKTNILNYRKVLSEYLLLPEFIPILSVFEKYDAFIYERTLTESIVFNRFRCDYIVGEVINVPPDRVQAGQVQVSVRKSVTSGHLANFVNPVIGNDAPNATERNLFRDVLSKPDTPHNWEALIDTDTGLIKWNDIGYFSIGVLFECDDMRDTTGRTSISSIVIKGITPTGEEHDVLRWTGRFHIEEDKGDWKNIHWLDYPAIPQSVLSDPIKQLTPEERDNMDKLIDHLNDTSYNHYYNRLIWMLEDPNKRAERFSKIEFNGKPLLDKIENYPLDVLGTYVAFYTDEIDAGIDGHSSLPEVQIKKVEKLMTLPTRGVFAEAKLGHCNASEIIDNTRFWDWQQSPITEQAPDIAPVSTDSRNVTQNLTPSQFPNSIVNIVSPSNAPDPTGMSAALNLLGQSDLFRDMSMSKEVNDLLKKLSDNSISIAEAANKAREISANQEIEKNKATTALQGAAENAKTSKEPSLTPQQFMDWMNAAKNSPISSQDKKELMQEVKEAAKTSVNPSNTKKQIATSNQKFMHFRMHTQGDQILQATGLWKLDIHHDGRIDLDEDLSIIDGLAYYDYSNNNIKSDGSIFIRGEAQISSTLDRGLIAKIPNLSPPSGKFQFSGNASFKFDKTSSTISFDVLATTKRINAEVFVETGGSASVTYSANIEANIEIVKISGGPEINAELNGKLGTKINYEIEYLTGGLTIRQER